MLPKAVRDVARELMRLPGIGPKTAQRLSVYLLRQPAGAVTELATTLQDLHASVQLCTRCFNLAEAEQCTICHDASRSAETLCVVEDPLDVEAIERTSAYTGRYHVLGGVLSPIEGITIDKLTIVQLLQRVSTEPIAELIIALDHTIESEATARHIRHALEHSPVRITRLARGLPTGGDIEFADTLTLTAALSGRR